MHPKMRKQENVARLKQERDEYDLDPMLDLRIDSHEIEEPITKRAVLESYDLIEPNAKTSSGKSHEAPARLQTASETNEALISEGRSGISSESPF